MQRAPRENLPAGSPVPAAGLLFAPAQEQVFPQSDRSRDLGEGWLAYDGRAQPRQLSLGRPRPFLHEPFAHDEGQDRVAEELQAFVVLRETVFVGVGTVGKSALQQAGVAEGVGDPLLELGMWAHVRCGTS